MAHYFTDENVNLIKIAGNYGGGFNIKQLWINPSPSSAFAGQTVSLDLTDYNMVLILFKWKSSDADTGSTIIPKGYAGYVGAPYTSANRYQRTITNVSNNGVIFDNGVIGGSYDNTSCVPIFIYGIKVV